MPAEAMVQPDEISQILKKQLLGFEKEVDVYNRGIPRGPSEKESQLRNG